MVDILIGMVAIFVTCNIPHLVLATYEMLSSHISDNDKIMYEGWRVVAANLTNLLLSASHTLNIFVFCCKVPHFSFPLLPFIMRGNSCFVSSGQNVPGFALTPKG